MIDDCINNKIQVPHVRLVAVHPKPLCPRLTPIPAQKGALARWIMARRTRAALRALDAHLLDDIGMTEGQAKREAARPFWQ